MVDFQSLDFGVTRGDSAVAFVAQHPWIVLLDSINVGDVLTVTVGDRASAFVPASAAVSIDSIGVPEVRLSMVEKGCIEVSLTTAEVDAVHVMVYDADGSLVATYGMTDDEQLRTASLPDGDYTVVAMASTATLGGITTLADYGVIGLAEGSDYVATPCSVRSGRVTQLSVDGVPAIDESRFYYTDETTAIAMGKPSVSVGNYLTLRAHVGIKAQHQAAVSDVRLVIELPDGVEYVEGSAMAGNAKVNATLDGRRLSVDIPGRGELVRLCIVPTQSGTLNIGASAALRIGQREVLQPIGSASAIVEALRIVVPPTTATPDINVSGMAPAGASVEIYDGRDVVGHTTAQAGGLWFAACRLDKPYNLSQHEIHAVLTTTDGGGDAVADMHVRCQRNRGA